MFYVVMYSLVEFIFVPEKHEEETELFYSPEQWCL